MAIFYYVDQYSDAWNALRLGKPTSSQFHRIITPTGKKSDQYKDYAYHLLAERCLKRAEDTYTSEYMERGAELEPEAANYYSFTRDVEAKRVGFITDDLQKIGCSPDRLIGDKGLLEIKAPKPSTMFKYLCEQNIEDKYKPQLQGQLFISEREWVDIVSYHPEPEMEDAIIIMRVERDDVYCRLMEQYLKEFENFMEDSLIKISKTLRSNSEMMKSLRGENVNNKLLAG